MNPFSLMRAMVGDPFTSFRFRVEINGISIAKISEVTGLQVETEVETYEEGGVNDFVHQFPKKTKYHNIVLKRGVTILPEMWAWYQSVVFGVAIQQTIAIVLMDIKGNDTWWWFILDAYPVKWIGPDLKADSNTVAFETIELAHSGILGAPLGKAGNLVSKATAATNMANVAKKL